MQPRTHIAGVPGLALPESVRGRFGSRGQPFTSTIGFACQPARRVADRGVLVTRPGPRSVPSSSAAPGPFTACLRRGEPGRPRDLARPARFSLSAYATLETAARRCLSQPRTLSGAGAAAFTSTIGFAEPRTASPVNLPGIVAARDSKEAHGPALTFRPGAWHAFTARLRRGTRPGRRGSGSGRASSARLCRCGPGSSRAFRRVECFQKRLNETLSPPVPRRAQRVWRIRGPVRRRSGAGTARTPPRRTRPGCPRTRRTRSTPRDRRPRRSRCAPSTGRAWFPRWA